jgi:hypothetical protein
MQNPSSDDLDPKLKALIAKVDKFFGSVQGSNAGAQGKYDFQGRLQKNQPVSKADLDELKFLIYEQFEINKKQAEINQRLADMVQKQSDNIERLMQVIEGLFQQPGK